MAGVFARHILHLGEFMKIKNTKYLYRTKFLDLNSTEFDDNNGESKFYIWAQRPLNKKAVVIVAVVDNGFKEIGNGSGYKRDLRLVVIKERRIPINGFEYGFPAGLINDGEDLLEAANRELFEETNLKLKRIIKASPFVYNSTGITDESIAMVFCEAEGKISTKNNEASEDIEVFMMSQQEVSKLIDDSNKKFGAKAWIIMSNFAQSGSII